MVNLIINIDPNLKKAHQLSQDYREFNCLQSREEAEKEIDEIIEKIDQSKLNSFKDFSNMLKTWKEYLRNSFFYYPNFFKESLFYRTCSTFKISVTFSLPPSKITQSPFSTYPYIFAQAMAWSNKLFVSFCNKALTGYTPQDKAN